jgi:hypothetical protein
MSSDDLRFGPLGMPNARNHFWSFTSAEGDCLGFMAGFHKCYIEADVPEKECRSWRNDYTECKLHFREVFYSLLMFCIETKT